MRPSGNTPDVTDQTLVVPIHFPEPEITPISDTTAETLAGFDVVLFGYWATEEEPATARETNEPAAKGVLYEAAATLSRAGAVTDVRLDFGPESERPSRQEALAAEIDADGVLLPARLPALRELLVPVRDSRQRDAILDVVSAFDPDHLIEVHLYHATEEESAVSDKEAMLRELRSELVTRRFPEAVVTMDVEVTDDTLYSVGQQARNYEVTVVGGTEEHDAADRIFGPASEYVLAESDSPVLVVRS